MDVLDQLVQFPTGNVGIPFDVDDLDLPTRLQYRFKDFEGRALDVFGNVHQLHAEAQIRLVGAEARHRLVPRHAQEGRLKLDPEGFGKDLPHHAFHHGEDGFLIRKGHLDVELRELRLSVSAKVFIPEAADDLEIFLKPRHHQDLLVDLGRLRERVKRPGV